jgi:hypothetical protein
MLRNRSGGDPIVASHKPTKKDTKKPASPRDAAGGHKPAKPSDTGRELTDDEIAGVAGGHAVPPGRPPGTQ